MSPIAPLRPSDRTRWGELWLEYQQFYGVVITPNATESLWARLQDGRINALGARDATERLVGIVHFLYHEDTWSAARACYLQDLYVDPAVRRTGCGRGLIEAVAIASQQSGANTPYWLTHANNVIARQLYDRIARNQGFIQYQYSTPTG